MTRGFVIAAALSLSLAGFCQAQDLLSPGGLHQFLSTSHSAEIAAALESFRSSESSDQIDQAAARLMDLAEQRNQEKAHAEAADLARHVFLSSANAKARQRAFAILDQTASIHLAHHTQEIVVLVPNVSCYGRFLDSLERNVRDQTDWIYKVGIRNTYRVQQDRPASGLIIGTIAELKFTVDRNKSPSEFAETLLTKAGANAKHWQIQVPTKISQLLEQPN